MKLSAEPGESVGPSASAGVDTTVAPSQTPMPSPSPSAEPSVEPSIEPSEESTLKLPQNPHYYAVSLCEFIRNATGKVSAVLYDLDGCGNDEMIVFDEGITDNDYWASVPEGGKIAVFDSKNGMNISVIIEPPEYGIEGYWLYISNKNHLILNDVFEGEAWFLYKYENGSLTEDAVLVDGCYAEREYYSVNRIECDETLFRKKFNEYDIKNIAVTISIGEALFSWGWMDAPTSRDDTAKILAMTIKQ